MSGRHDAYAPIVHEREVTALHGRGWIVVDRVLGEGFARAAAMWHVHPSWRLEELDGSTARFRHLDGTPAAILASVPLHQVTDGGLNEFAPEYGRVEEAVCLECVVDAAAPFSLVTVIPADGLVETARELASTVQDDSRSCVE
jgi:hypothetical protein